MGGCLLADVRPVASQHPPPTPSVVSRDIVCPPRQPRDALVVARTVEGRERVERVPAHAEAEAGGEARQGAQRIGKAASGSEEEVEEEHEAASRRPSAHRDVAP